jgi:hypothetical protein
MPSSLNLVPPAPFPQPLASDVDDIPSVIVDETDLPNQDSSKDHLQVEPLASHPLGVDAGEGTTTSKPLNGSDDGIIRDSLTLGELRKYVEGAAFKVKVRQSGNRLIRNRDITHSRILTSSL